MLIEASCRIKNIKGKEYIDHILKTGEPAIFCFWHNNIFYCAPFLYRNVRKLKSAVKTAVLISRSKDAEPIARVVEMWGGIAIRGSSTRFGREALIGLSKHLRNKNRTTVSTPDGPKGPKYFFKEGTIALAQYTGVPIIPFNFQAKKQWVLKSWDNFIIPKPFSKVSVHIAKPYYVPRKLSDTQQEKTRKEIENIMLQQIKDNQKALENM